MEYERLNNISKNRAVEIICQILCIVLTALMIVYLIFALKTQWQLIHAEETDYNIASETIISEETRKYMIEKQKKLPIIEIEDKEEKKKIEKLTEQETTKTVSKTKAETKSKVVEKTNDTEYYYAKIIWNYLTTEMNLSKYCAAGIMGNIMTECGGQTLNIQPYILNSSNCYGICQWYIKYFPQVKDADIYEQLDFLKSTIKWILNDYGDRYYSGFNYQKFIEITDEREAAKAFAHAYEGCGKVCATRRLEHATTALKYFTGE